MILMILYKLTVHFYNLFTKIIYKMTSISEILMIMNSIF